MVRRDKDMLENMLAALRPEESSTPASSSLPGDSSSLPPGGSTEAAGPFGSSGGSFGGSSGASAGMEAFPLGRASTVARGEELPPWRRPLVIRFALLQLPLLVVAFFVGRSSVSPVEASDAAGFARGAGRPPAVEPSTFQPFPTGSTGPTGSAGTQPSTSTAAELRERPGGALFDPSNRYAVLVITYERNPSNEDLAWESYYALREQGLPVFSPAWHNERIFLLAGAAPRMTDLDDIQSRVRAAMSPRGRPEYATAYTVPIDNFVSR